MHEDIETGGADRGVACERLHPHQHTLVCQNSPGVGVFTAYCAAGDGLSPRTGTARGCCSRSLRSVLSLRTGLQFPNGQSSRRSGVLWAVGRHRREMLYIHCQRYGSSADSIIIAPARRSDAVVIPSLPAESWRGPSQRKTAARARIPSRNGAERRPRVALLASDHVRGSRRLRRDSALAMGRRMDQRRH